MAVTASACRSSTPRRGARQQENFTLALGVDGARELPERLQELIGYSIHPPFMGMVDGRHPKKLLT